MSSITTINSTVLYTFEDAKWSKGRRQEQNSDLEHLSIETKRRGEGEKREIVTFTKERKGEIGTITKMREGECYW